MKHILALLLLIPSLAWGQVSIWSRPPMFSAQVASTSSFSWDGRSIITSPADGTISFTNAAGTSFTKLTLGPATAGFPALRFGSGPIVEVVTGNEGAFAGLKASNLEASGAVRFTSSSAITAPSDGILTLANAAGTDFTRLQLGGTTNSFPAITRSAATISIGLADDSNWAGLTAHKFTSKSGAAPTMGACGTSPSAAGSSSAMKITVGTGGVATTCAVTFPQVWTTAPACVVQNDTDRVAYSIVTTTTVLTITATAAFTASSIFHVICIGV